MIRFQFLLLASFVALAIASTFAEPITQPANLLLAPTDANPRNSEGDFITLKDGRILFV